MNTPPPPPVYNQNPYYPNNSQNSFEDKYKNMYFPGSNNSKQSSQTYRNTFWLKLITFSKLISYVV